MKQVPVSSISEPCMGGVRHLMKRNESQTELKQRMPSVHLNGDTRKDPAGAVATRSHGKTFTLKHLHPAYRAIGYRGGKYRRPKRLARAHNRSTKRSRESGHDQELRV
jgi:hypothetical protein